MKKIILSSCFLLCSLTLGANENIYKGCGINENDARVNLANNISTKIETTTSLEKSNSSIFGMSLFGKTFTKSSIQTSNLSLKNVQITKEGDKTCASIDKEELYDLAIKLISKANKYSKADLPKYQKDKVVKINDILSDIKNAIVLYEVYQDRLKKQDINKLNAQQKIFTNLREKYHSQFIKVVVVGEYDSLKIDGKSQKQNKEVFVKPGVHKLQISSNNFCPISQDIKIAPKEDKQIVINMQDYNYPYILIDANKKDAKLTVNNKSIPLGKKHVINKCDGSNIAYSITYEDQKENDILKLNPNEYIKENFTFYSNKELKEFSSLAKSYEDNTRLEIKYGYIGVNINDDYEDFDNIHSIQINMLNTTKALRYGYGIAYGQDNDAKSKIYELYYNLGLQLTRLGENSTIRLGPIVMIPSITAQIGVGYHDLYNTVTEKNIDKFPKKPTDEEDDFFRDYGVLKTTFGIDFIVNKNIGLNIFAQKQFTMEESTTFGAGLSLSF